MQSRLMPIIRESAVKRSSDEPPSFSPSFPPGRFSPIFSSLLFLSLSETRRFFSRFKARPILGIDGRRGRDFPLPEIAGTPRVFFLNFIRSFNEAFNEEEKDASRRNDCSNGIHSYDPRVCSSSKNLFLRKRIETCSRTHAFQPRLIGGMGGLCRRMNPRRGIRFS